MICCLDVDYQDDKGHCAAVLFRQWDDATPANIHTSITDPVAPYEPGAFYKRELPCMLNTLNRTPEKIDVLVIDGYVWLGENRPGLGHFLYEALKTPVIGVAKTRFRGADAVTRAVLCGQSNNPLWVTAIGMDVEEAARRIKSMSGPNRLPDLIKLADTACRKWPI